MSALFWFNTALVVGNAAGLVHIYYGLPWPLNTLPVEMVLLVLGFMGVAFSLTQTADDFSTAARLFVGGNCVVYFLGFHHFLLTLKPPDDFFGGLLLVLTGTGTIAFLYLLPNVDEYYRFVAATLAVSFIARVSNFPFPGPFYFLALILFLASITLYYCLPFLPIAAIRPTFYLLAFAVVVYFLQISSVWMQQQQQHRQWQQQLRQQQQQQRQQQLKQQEQQQPGLPLFLFGYEQPKDWSRESLYQKLSYEQALLDHSDNFWIEIHTGKNITEDITDAIKNSYDSYAVNFFDGNQNPLLDVCGLPQVLQGQGYSEGDGLSEETRKALLKSEHLLIEDRLFEAVSRVRNQSEALGLFFTEKNTGSEFDDLVHTLEQVRSLLMEGARSYLQIREFPLLSNTSGHKNPDWIFQPEPAEPGPLNPSHVHSIYGKDTIWTLGGIAYLLQRVALVAEQRPPQEHYEVPAVELARSVLAQRYPNFLQPMPSDWMATHTFERYFDHRKFDKLNKLLLAKFMPYIDGFAEGQKQLMDRLSREEQIRISPEDREQGKTPIRRKYKKEIAEFGEAVGVLADEVDRFTSLTSNITTKLNRLARIAHQIKHTINRQLPSNLLEIIKVDLAKEKNRFGPSTVNLFLVAKTLWEAGYKVEQAALRARREQVTHYCGLERDPSVSPMRIFSPPTRPRLDDGYGSPWWVVWATPYAMQEGHSAGFLDPRMLMNPTRGDPYWGW